MKVTRVTSITILSLLLGFAASASAMQDDKPSHSEQQQSKPEQGKPEQQHAQQQRQPDQNKQQPQNTQEQPQQNQQQRAGQQQQHQNQNSQQQRAQQENQNTQQQHASQQQRQNQNGQLRAQQQQKQNNQQQQAKQQRSNGLSGHGQQQQVQQAAWQKHRSQSWDSDHRTWQQRGGYNGYRIPDDRFRGYFGQAHAFRIHGLPFRVVAGYPRFQYDGYWLSLVDPWPQSWANNWYDTDDVYVNYIDNGYYLFDRRHPGT